MNINEFKEFLAKLEQSANTKLGEPQLVKYFTRNDGENVIACPWLNWWKGSPNADPSKIRGILIMQDWWNENGLPKLEDEMAYIKNHAFKFSEDRTNYNLFKFKGWKDAIWCHKTWLVTNAVWGLRSGDKQSGYLGAKIHKVAFTIWAKIIVALATNKDFKVVFAGDWAVFDDPIKNDGDLKKFLANWREWAAADPWKNHDASSLNFSCVAGKAVFCPHPSVWKFGFDYLAGPPD